MVSGRYEREEAEKPMTDQPKHPNATVLAPVLEFQDVTVGYRLDQTALNVVRNVSLTVHAGETYGIVGESGSGKTTLLLAAMRYLPPNGAVTSGQILFEGEDLLRKSTAQMRDLWGKRLSMVPQDPGGSLNPALTVGRQLTEIVRHHQGLNMPAARERALALLREVRIADAERILTRYPHQLSGGMQQRALIAMALAAEPTLLVLDEPTTNLDVTTESTVLDLFRDLVRRHNTGTLYVTHNLGVVAQICDRAAVLYAGELMEDASVPDLFARPLHPYTMELMSCVPRLATQQSRVRLRTIKGNIPSQAQLPAGCIFAPRCPLAIEKCYTDKPVTEQATSGHTVKCHRWREIADGSIGHDILGIVDTHRSMPTAISPRTQPHAPLLDVQHVQKRFILSDSLVDLLRQREPLAVRAVDDVTLEVRKGETLGLVGESGSGKTTLARVIVGLVQRDSGTLRLSELDLAPRVERRPQALLKRLQMVFQNPEESLNPYLTIGDALRRSLHTAGGVPTAQVEGRACELLRAVHLDESYMERFPAELSGGEKQRAAIARAFATDPELIVCDESVSALDVSVQASILNLLQELKVQNDTAYLFISHDLAVVSYLADTIAVMYLGQIVEIGKRDALFASPNHPYTEALISAVPVPDPTAPDARIRLEADIPSPVNVPSGCRFHTRCPRKIGPLCETTAPPWVDAGDGHFLRCHIPLAELQQAQQAMPSPLPTALP